MLYYVGGRSKVAGYSESTGELNWRLLENKNAFINESCLVFDFFLVFIFSFSELGYKFLMLINVSSFMAVKRLSAGQAACVYSFQKSGFAIEWQACRV